MLPCLIGLFRPLLIHCEKKIKKEQTDNYYTVLCTAGNNSDTVNQRRA